MTCTCSHCQHEFEVTASGAGVLARVTCPGCFEVTWVPGFRRPMAANDAPRPGTPSALPLVQRRPLTSGV